MSTIGHRLDTGNQQQQCVMNLPELPTEAEGLDPLPTRKRTISDSTADAKAEARRAANRKSAFESRMRRKVLIGIYLMLLLVRDTRQCILTPFLINRGLTKAGRRSDKRTGKEQPRITNEMISVLIKHHLTLGLYPYLCFRRSSSNIA